MDFRTILRISQENELESEAQRFARDKATREALRRQREERSGLAQGRSMSQMLTEQTPRPDGLTPLMTDTESTPQEERSSHGQHTEGSFPAPPTTPEYIVPGGA